MINIKKLKRCHSEFYTLFNIHSEEFDSFVKNIEFQFKKSELERREKTNKKHKVITTGSGRPFKCPIEQRVAIYLIYRRSQISHKLLGEICEVDESRISQYFKQLKPIIELYPFFLGHGLRVPKEEILNIINRNK